MAGISSKAMGALENKKKYNGIEFENDLDINDYDAFFRDLDPQTGRWWEIDPMIENMEQWSPYVSNYDNPITYSDPMGDTPSGGLGDAIDDIVTSASGVVMGFLNTATGGLIPAKPLGVILTGINLTEHQQDRFDQGVSVGQLGGYIIPLMGSPNTGKMEPRLVPANGGKSVSVETTPNVVLPSNSDRVNSKSTSSNEKVNGNNKQSTKEQHNYDVVDTHNNNSVVKTGTSGGKETKEGVSYRGTSQANRWNNQEGTPGRYKSVTTNRVPSGPGSRQKALDYENNRARQVKDQLDPLKHKRPRG